MEDIHYSMVIEWDDRDNIFVVTIPELQGCKTHGKTYEEALKNGKDAIELWVETSKELGQPIPEPKKYAA